MQSGKASLAAVGGMFTAAAASGSEGNEENVTDATCAPRREEDSEVFSCNGQLPLLILAKQTQKTTNGIQ